jgi:hypothetical protein
MATTLVVGYAGTLQTLPKQRTCRLKSCSCFLNKQSAGWRSRVILKLPPKPMLVCSQRETEAESVQVPNTDGTKNKQVEDKAQIMETDQEQEQEIDVTLTPEELREQARRLDKLAKEWREERLQEEREANRKFGFVPFAETINGRFAMFFFIVGLLTEYWTGFTIVDQIEYMLEILGFK